MFPPLFNLLIRIDIHVSFLRLIPTSKYLETFLIMVLLSLLIDLITTNNKSRKIKGLYRRLVIRYRNRLKLSTYLNIDSS